MLKINQIIKAVIYRLDAHGNGIVKVQKDIISVPGVLLQEEVDIKIIKKVKSGYIGEVIQIHKSSPERVKPQCGIYEKCGSCHYLHMDYKAQLRYKKDVIQTLYKKENYTIKVHDVIGMEEPYAYRNKIIVGFSMDKKRNITAGFYEEYSHRIIPYKHCLLHDEVCDNIIQSVVSLMKRYHIEPYDEDRKKGLLRHVLIRKATITKEIMVVFVLGQKIFPGSRNFVSALTKAYPNIKTIIQNVNMRSTSIVLGNEEKTLYGSGFIEDELCGLRFRISSKSFYQINHDQCQRLYEKAIALLEPSGKETMIDAYCGIGTIGMYASSFVKEVIGVEVNKDAIKDAQNNAKYNRVKNIRFICEDAGKFMVSLANRKQHVDAVIMDPPRSGSTQVFIDALNALQPSKVIYVSCDPATQLRDLKYFKKLGYVAQDMYLYDMFPNTYHVETVCLLVKSR